MFSHSSMSNGPWCSWFCWGQPQNLVSLHCWSETNEEIEALLLTQHFKPLEWLAIFQFASKMVGIFQRIILAAVLIARDSERLWKFMVLLNDSWVFWYEVSLLGTPPALDGHATPREKSTGKDFPGKEGESCNVVADCFVSKKRRIMLQIQSSGRRSVIQTQLMMWVNSSVVGSLLILRISIVMLRIAFCSLNNASWLHG